MTWEKSFIFKLKQHGKTIEKENPSDTSQMCFLWKSQNIDKDSFINVRCAGGGYFSPMLTSMLLSPYHPYLSRHGFPSVNRPRVSEGVPLSAQAIRPLQASR